MDIYLIIIRLCKEIEYLAIDFKHHIPRMYDGELVTLALDMLTKEGMTKEELKYVIKEFEKIKIDRTAYPYYGSNDLDLGFMITGFINSNSQKRLG